MRINDVLFDNLEIPLENILGFDDGKIPSQDAFSAAQDSFNFMRPLLAAAICGTTRRMLDVVKDSFPTNKVLNEKVGYIEVENEISLTLCYKASIEQEKNANSTLSSAITKYQACQVNKYVCDLINEYYGPSLFYERIVCLIS